MNGSLFTTIKDGNVSIGGVSIKRLAHDFATPLYIVDEGDFKATANVFRDNFKSKEFDTKIIYASKAFTNLYMSGLTDSLGLCTDVVSAGEIYISLKGGVKPENMYFHGNNKLKDELLFAMRENVGTIVIDSTSEYELISEILDENKLDSKKVSCLIRVNPSIKADTHEYIQTGGDDSKFGISVHSDEVSRLIKKISSDDRFDFRGFHCHIGSQIHDEKFFFYEVEVMLNFAKQAEKKCGIKIKEMNLGGGFGVYYTSKDKPMDLPEFLRKYTAKIENEVKKHKLHLETVSIEPGRSLINKSVTMIYTVGSVKTTMTGVNYIFVDGGMTDNIRPALYSAEYEAFVDGKIHEGEISSSYEDKVKYTIAGKCCESGDKLIKDIMLPEVRRGDIILIPNAGAYTYSMASNYNKLPIPAVVFVEKGKAKSAVKRQSFEDMIINDEMYV